MNTSGKKRRNRGASSPLSLQFLGLLLAISGFFLALVGFVGLFTSSGSGAIVIMVIGGLMAFLGVVLGRSQWAARIVFWQ
jgi:hypothetical protein